MTFRRYFKDHWLGYLAASLGIILNVVYLFECTRQGVDIYTYITSDIIHHAAIFSTIPLFLTIGFLTDRKMALERERREYTKSLNQKIEELKESQRKHRALLEEAPIPIFTLDREGRFTWGNKKIKDLTGYHASELIGKSIAQLLSQNDARKLLDRLSNLTHGLQLEVEIQEQRKIVELTMQPVKIAGELSDIQCLAIDVTEKREMEREIIASYRYLSSIISNSADAIIALDINGKIMLFNEAAERIFGYKKEEVVGRNLVENGEVKFYKNLETARYVMQKMRESSGKVSGVEVEGKTKDGRDIYLNVSASLLRNERGEVIGSLGVIKDITEHKRSRDVQAAINSLLQLSLENISLDEILKKALDLILSIPRLSLESRGCIFLVEEPGELTMKVQRGLSSAIQNSCAQVTFGRCICGLAALSREIEFAGKVDERHETRYDGMTAHGHYCIPILYAGEILGVINLYLKAGHNYNDKEVEFLQAVANVLASIIKRKQLEREILEAKEDAELYLDILSHDINNLNQVAFGYLELLLDSKLDEKQRTQVERTLNSTLGGIKLIEDVRLLQRIKELRGAGLQDIDLNEVIIQVIAEFSASSQKKIAFKYIPRTFLVKADPLIKEVFVNLIGNSIKYSGESVEIGIDVEEFVKDNRFYRVCVEDNGDGVPDELKVKIFNRFERGTKKARGRGLGLYIVKTLIERYGGEVWVEDRVKGDYKQGSRFCFTVPKAEVRENETRD